ncbi:hypothetical protein DUK53_16005 [Listeria sp. SHR_NRA_18]|nr:hypothetical protein DUK53_16005 [Listeria sp. SHR_NRA_18]
MEIKIKVKTKSGSEIITTSQDNFEATVAKFKNGMGNKKTKYIELGSLVDRILIPYENTDYIQLTTNGEEGEHE